MRGATIFSTRSAHWRTHFNPRSSCEERLVEAAMMRDASMISIHAPHARSDACQPGKDYSQVGFNPRSSCEERLCRRHAGTAGSDFNPRSSCEERLIGRWCNERCLHFNPRSSCEERRQPAAMSCVARHFNPRSSCEERPSGVRGVSWSQANFNPRSSCEERHAEIPMRG